MVGLESDFLLNLKQVQFLPIMEAVCNKLYVVLRIMKHSYLFLGHCLRYYGLFSQQISQRSHASFIFRNFYLSIEANRRNLFVFQILLSHYHPIFLFPSGSYHVSNKRNEAME